MRSPVTRARLAHRLEAARGSRPASLVLRDVQWLDVFTATFRRGDVAVDDGVVVATRESGTLDGVRVVEGRGRHLVPGFVDAHVHVESSLSTPETFQAVVLPRGTTTAVCDPHELANVLGTKGIRYFLDASERLAMDLRVMMSSCVPATTFETNGAGAIEAAELAALGAHPRSLGLAEMMNVPGAVAGDPGVLDKLLAFQHGPVDGHAPLVTGRALDALATCGISTCHESSELDEAREKLAKGMRVWIREGSVAKDLDRLVPLLELATSTEIAFCTDDRNPLDIAEEGHLDHLVRRAIAHGVAPEVVYRAVSYAPARHYGLAGPAAGERRGAVAPGWAADLVLLDDAVTCAVASVLKDGVPVDELAAPVASSDDDLRGTVRAAVPAAADLVGPPGRVHVIGVRPGRILTDRLVRDHDDADVSRLTVLERYGHGRAPSNGYVHGFGRLGGAIASSVGHDSHNLCVVGREPEDMRAALAALVRLGGGFVVVRGGAVVAELALPIGGLMTPAPAAEIARALHDLRAASRAIGCVLPEPFLQLAFLSLPVIPSLKLTDHGLVDVDAFRIVDVRAA